MVNEHTQKGNIMRDSCEYCGKELLAKQKRKHRDYFYHAQCKEWQKEREQAQKENNQ